MCISHAPLLSNSIICLRKRSKKREIENMKLLVQIVVRYCTTPNSISVKHVFNVDKTPHFDYDKCYMYILLFAFFWVLGAFWVFGGESVQWRLAMPPNATRPQNMF